MPVSGPVRNFASVIVGTSAAFSRQGGLGAISALSTTRRPEYGPPIL
jgi:hypothetical protein